MGRACWYPVLRRPTLVPLILGILDRVGKHSPPPTANASGGRAGRDAVVARIDRNPLVRVLLILLAAVVVTSLVAQMAGETLHGQNIGRAMIFGLFILATATFHLFIGHRTLVFERNRRIVVVFGLILLQISLARLAQFGAVVLDMQHPALITPMALAPVVLCVLLGHRMGVYAALYTSLLGALVVSDEYRFLFIIFGLGCSLVGIAATLRVRRRGRLVQAGLYVGLIHLALALTFGVTTPIHATLAGTDWMKLLSQTLCILSVELGTVILLGGLLPVFEGLADVTTDISWIELSDLNNPLLKRMTIETPGTYHHSLVVATLAEAAAEAVNANPTMVRVCSYFHDIGKLENPSYFIENLGGGPNPHDQLTPSMSALKIIAHVKDGVALARKQKLNRQIIDVIKEHHGNSLVAYFHRKAMALHEQQMQEVRKGLRREEDVCEINEEDFRYKGPRPSTKESVIVSLADAVESASRTLPQATPEGVGEMVGRIFAARMQDGQLAAAPVTLHELEVIRESFLKTLRSLLHARVPYPAEHDESTNGGGSVKATAGVAAAPPAEPAAPVAPATAGHAS